MLWKPSISSPISTQFKSLWMQLSTVDQGKMTRIGSAGVARRQDVDISSLRHVNHAICLLITGGARESSFRNIKTIYECLADELSNSHKGSSNSYAIKKKNEIERVAKANR